jgi:exosortase family protein XrtF
MSMKAFSLQEFKPTILFLVKFVGLYLVLNVVYGLYVKKDHPRPDSATVSITHQTAAVLDVLGWEVSTINHPKKPTTSIVYQNRGIVSVYEGCNGINVIIIFLCFLIAFGPLNKKLAWFAPLGILIIHMANLGRILGLFWVVIYMPNAVYFTHKYLFTAFIYAVVFGMWLIWLRVNYTKVVKPV